MLTVTVYYNHTILESLICSKNAHVKDITSSFNEATAMICSDYSCSLPAGSVDEVNERLNEL